MERTEPNVFGGVVGTVLHESMSLRTLVSGLVFVLVVWMLGALLKAADAENVARVLAAVLGMLALARFALNGYAGEWGGTLFSLHGGSWIAAGRVGLRYGLLCSVWLLPILVLGWRPEAAGEAMAQALLGGGGGKILALTVIGITLAALTPPLFLIVAVGAARWLDLVDVSHWRRLFAGRGGDLQLVYSVYLGAILFLALIGGPLFLAAGAIERGLATFLAFPILAFASGLSLDLLGRLCGFFAATAGEEEEAPAAVPQTENPRLSVVEGTAAPRAPVRPARPAYQEGEVERVSLNPSGKAPLLDARERVEEQIRRFETDAQGAITVLDELARDYAPQPLVLHALTLCLAHVGQTERSMAMAMEAQPLCLERGATRLAAEIYAAHLERGERFGLSRDVVLSLAHDLRKSGDLPASETAYVQILEKDAGERRAVKGLLVVAEDRYGREEYAEARRVYVWLRERCGDSPLLSFMERGIAECDRRLAKAS